MMKAVIDSDVLIDYLQGRAEAAEEMARYGEPCYSIISWMEIMCGARTEHQRKAAETLLNSMRMLELNHEIASRAVEVRQRLKLKLPDAIIMATAEVEGCLLLTRNSKDFDGSSPQVRIPYQL